MVANPGKPQEEAPRCKAVASLPLAVAVWALVSPGLGPAGEPDNQPLPCDGFSPFRNVCESCCQIMTPMVVFNATLFGFMGQVEMKLYKVADPGVNLTVTCWAILVPHVPATNFNPQIRLLGDCGLPVVSKGGPQPGDLVGLVCTAGPSNGPGLPRQVGPFGTWGCLVDFVG